MTDLKDNNKGRQNHMTNLTWQNLRAQHPYTCGSKTQISAYIILDLRYHLHHSHNNTSIYSKAFYKLSTYIPNCNSIN